MSLSHWFRRLLGRKNRNWSRPRQRFLSRRNRHPLTLERLEDRLAPATFTDNGTTLNLVLNTANSNAVIVSSGTAYALTLTGDTWSGADDANVAGNGTATLTITSAGITSFTTGISLTDSAAGTSVTFDDSGANVYANNFTIGLHNRPALSGLMFNGASSFGTFSLNANVDTTITVSGSGNVSTTSGTITLSANQGATPTSGDFDGIDLVGGTITSATGSILLQGKGGNSGSGNYGILALGGSVVSSTGTGASAAPITLVGSSGAGATGNFGILLTDLNTAITSKDGAIQLTGTGGAGTGSSNDGIVLGNAAQVSSTGTATVTLNGTGGGSGAATTDNIGVVINEQSGVVGSAVTSVAGAIQRSPPPVPRTSP